MKFLVTKNTYENLGLDLSNKVIIDEENLSIIRYHYFLENLQDYESQLGIIVPEPVSMRLYDTRDQKYIAIYHDSEFSHLSQATKYLYCERGVIDEWNISLSAITCSLNSSSLVFCNSKYKNYISEKYRFGKIKFYDIGTEIEDFL